MEEKVPDPRLGRQRAHAAARVIAGRRPAGTDRSPCCSLRRLRSPLRPDTGTRIFGTARCTSRSRRIDRSGTATRRHWGSPWCRSQPGLRVLPERQRALPGAQRVPRALRRSRRVADTLPARRVVRRPGTQWVRRRAACRCPWRSRSRSTPAQRGQIGASIASISLSAPRRALVQTLPVASASTCEWSLEDSSEPTGRDHTTAHFGPYVARSCAIVLLGLSGYSAKLLQTSRNVPE